MANDESSDVLSDAEARIAEWLIDEIDEFNLDATGIAEVHELLTVETDGDRELIAGVTAGVGAGRSGSRGASGTRGHAASRRREPAAAAVEKDDDAQHGCAQLARDPTRSKPRRSMSDTGFEAVGELTDYPKGHSKPLAQAASRFDQKGHRSSRCAGRCSVRRRPERDPHRTLLALLIVSRTGVAVVSVPKAE